MCASIVRTPWCCFFFFNDTATTEIYTLSLHDALPISWAVARFQLIANYVPQELPGQPLLNLAPMPSPVPRRRGLFNSFQEPRKDLHLPLILVGRPGPCSAAKSRGILRNAG